MFLGSEFPRPWRRETPATPEEERSASQAAALRIFLHAEGVPVGLFMGMAATPMATVPMGVMPLNEALTFLRDGAGLYVRRAKQLAVARLSVGAYVGDSARPEVFLPALIALLGAEQAAKLDSYFKDYMPASGWDEDKIREITYGGDPLDASTRSEPRAPGPAFPGSNSGNGCGESQQGVPPHDNVDFDHESFITTVQLWAESNRPFEQLTRLADPRHWEKNNSLFWNCSREVSRDTERQDWVPAPTTPSPPIGAAWDGWLFEEVGWSWNMELGTAAAFDVVLRVNSTVGANSPQYKAEFRLDQCLGSMLYGISLGNGIEVDDGCQLITPLPSKSEQPPRFRIGVTKRLRYASLGDRRAHQGPPMSGAILNILAPGLVSLWLYDMLHGFYSRSEEVE